LVIIHNLFLSLSPSLRLSSVDVSNHDPSEKISENPSHLLLCVFLPSPPPPSAAAARKGILMKKLRNVGKKKQGERKSNDRDEEREREEELL
jgi:hypothetical protein